MKRFSETAKWDDQWFRSLSGPQKLVFIYVIDRCDNAGFWEKDNGAVVYHTGLKLEHVEGAWKGLGRGLIEADGWLWVRRFLFHQRNEPIVLSNLAHRQIVTLLGQQVRRFGKNQIFTDWIAPYKGLLSPTGNVKVKSSQEESAERNHKFTPPRLDEWLARADELGYPRGDAEQAFHSYDAKGWRVGKTKMEKWKSAIQTCFSNYKNNGGSRNGNGTAHIPRKPTPDEIYQ